MKLIIFQISHKTMQLL